MSTSGGDPAIRYVTDPNRPLPVTIADGTRKYVWGPGLAYAVDGSALEVYQVDRLGSVRALTDASGAVTAGYRFDEFGLTTASTGSSAQPFAFTGEPLDATGLTYLRARYYDPRLGRFLSRDTVMGEVRSCQTLNRYAYALDDPLTDPIGQSSTSTVLTNPDPLGEMWGCDQAELGLGLGLLWGGRSIDFGVALAELFSVGLATPAVALGLTSGTTTAPSPSSSPWRPSSSTATLGAPGPTRAGGVRLHRGPVQSASASQLHRPAVAGRVREEVPFN